LSEPTSCTCAVFEPASYELTVPRSASKCAARAVRW
jgi:hypothetical protein